MRAAELDKGPGAARLPRGASAPIRWAGMALAWTNRIIATVAAVAVVAAGIVMTEEALARYFLHQSSDWQDETAIFLLVGATFLSAAYVQSRRGHVAIEAVGGLLPAGVEHVRRRVADLISFLFCGFFSWKSWVLCHEAWVEGYATFSSWAPPLWIPYLAMSAGMTLLTLQLALQLLAPQAGDDPMEGRAHGHG
ncbi:TRAP transporter small permease [Nitrospirillum viridazoti]|uniref:TRAP transporter small permease protein n=2 Tax=Nitrospirillum TaxID=1543705 RepID=A0A560IH36_9PROT|nr:TRAP transporter small permease [Nitrospirillum amazonense]TWB56394.1 TRAP-type C4-dicarboxylate transport system permease small subunit [Nitrospirillum amazonense]